MRQLMKFTEYSKLEQVFGHSIDYNQRSKMSSPLSFNGSNLLNEFQYVDHSMIRVMNPKPRN